MTVPLLALLLPQGALAQQQQRVVVIPADAGVVIAARGQAQPRSTLGAAPSAAALQRSRARPSAPLLDLPDGILGAPAPALLPLIAAGIVAATLAANQGQGGNAAPARTR